MSKKLKMLSFYFYLLLLTVIVLGITLIFTMKLTILKPDYIIDNLKKINYYDKVYNSINEEMQNYLIQSGLTSEVLTNIYTKEDIKNSLNNAIYTFYNNKKVSVDTNSVKANLENNINNYLIRHNIVVTETEALDLFVNQMLEIYTNEIIISTKINNFSIYLVKIVKLVDISIIVLGITTLLLLIFGHFFYKKNVATIPLASAGELLVLGNYLLFNKIDVKNILFWSDNVSSVIKTVILDMSNKIYFLGFTFIIAGIIVRIIYHMTRKITRKNRVR